MKLSGVVARLGRSKDEKPGGSAPSAECDLAASSKFPKSKHLLQHADFQRVYQSGRRQFTGNMTVFFLRRSGGPEATGTGNSLRVGFTVGKVLGGSVERNRIKRRMREAVRLSWPAGDGPGRRGVQSPQVRAGTCPSRRWRAK